MGNFKVRVNSSDESKEVQDLFEAIGYEKGACSMGNYPAIIVTTQDWATGGYCSTRALGLEIPAHDKYKELTLPELRAMVNPMKEYLNKETYAYVRTRNLVSKDSNWIEIPEGAVKATFCNDFLIFWKDDFFSLSRKNGDTDFTFNEKEDYGFVEYMDINDDAIVIWQRESEAESLVDWSHVIDNAQQIFDHENAGKPSLNDQYAEIEQVRQASKDNVNHPSHYTQGKVECIDALESATIGKSGIEAVCVANVIKYLWRYEEKNGLEDVKKAQWYLERLVASMDS